MPQLILEIAVDTLEDAITAQAAGADRLELVADLHTNGLTPSVELLRDVLAAVRIPVVAMVRPSPGHFTHDATTWRRHLHDADTLLAAGAHGVVFGTTTTDGSPNETYIRELVRLAATYSASPASPISTPARETIIHRAFDLAPDPARSLKLLADCGITRILTAGQSPATAAASLGLTPPTPAPDSLDTRLRRFKALIAQARSDASATEHPQILICGGVRSTNVADFLTATGATQIHSAARVGSPPKFSREECAKLRAAFA
jgi:copper homeostasis protein